MRLLPPFYKTDQLRDSRASFCWMPQIRIGVHFIVIPPPFLCHPQIVVFHQVVDNPLDGSLSDTRALGDVPQSQIRVCRQA